MLLLTTAYLLVGTFAQSQLLTGKVVAAQTAEPLAGATLVLKHGKAAVTKSDGTFTITLTGPTDTLIVTHTGYNPKQVVVHASGPPLTIALQPVGAAMEDVVVSTGYQQIPKERATGSFAVIDNKTLNMQVGTNILDRLNGVAPGVLFPQKLNGPGIIVRGLSTIQGPAAPLVVVDNFPYEGDINNINPNDVENITILKDAAAASIWGARAGNGVIVITTKKGRFNQPLRVTLNTNVTTAEKPDLFAIPQISSSDFIDVEQFLFSKGYYNAEINSFYRTPLSPVVELLIKKANGRLPAAEADAQIDAYRSHDIRNDYYKYLYRSQHNQQYAINLSAGSGNIAYTLSAGFDKNIDELASEYSRLNIRSENIYKPSKNLLLTVGILYTAANSNPSGRPSYGNIRVGSRQLPYLRLAGGDGTPLPVARDYREGYIDTAGGGKLLNWQYRPLQDYRYGESVNATRSIVSRLGAQYTLFKGLTADVKYQYENQQVNLKSIEGLQSYGTRNMINLYTQLNYATGSLKHIVPLGDILRTSSAQLQSHNVRGQLAFNRSFNKHAFAAIIGTEIRHTSNIGSNATVYGYNDDVLTTSRIDFVNTYPTFVSGNTASVPDGISFSDKLTRFASGFANIAWTFSDRYTLSGSSRKDASNLFGVATNEKGVPLWSVGGAWHISKEQFYNIKALPYLKFRATYGFQGNIDPGRSAVTTVAYTSSASYTNLQQVSVNQFANPLLRWEKVAMLNAGLDFAFAKELISGSIELYRKKATDLFGSAPIDYTAGLGNAAVTRNVAEMKGRGIEAVLNTKAKISIINWTGTVLFNYSKSTTTKFYRPVSLARILLSNGNSISALEGGSLYSVISYKWGGLNSSGAPQGYLNDTLSTDYNSLTGSGTPLDGLVYKNALPAYFGSFTNSFQYKGLSLSANITYKLGYWFRKSSFTYGGLFSTGAGHSDYAKRWQKPGDELITNIPAFVYPLVANSEAFYINSEATTANAGHVRLQFVSLAYELNKTQWKALPLRSVQVYLNASNLGILWRANKEGLDPDFADIPPVKTFSVGFRTGL